MQRYVKRRSLIICGIVLGLFALAASWLSPFNNWAKAHETQDTNSPIKHVVVIMMENHTFDNLFGRFPGVNGAIEPQASNPLEGDNDHTSPAAIAAIDGGKMDEFLPRGSVQYTQNELPNYYAYAHQFGISDNFFIACTRTHPASFGWISGIHVETVTSRLESLPHLNHVAPSTKSMQMLR